MKSSEEIKAPLISIIVPVYNTSQYLPRCIDSILQQSHQKLEVILVNDGSIDTSGNVCEQYKKRDARVQVIHRENAGVSSARNVGLNVAQGEWVGFVDSDDWIEPMMYEKLLHSATQYNKLIASCGAEIHDIDPNKETTHITHQKVPSTITQHQYFEYAIQDLALVSSVCTKLFNRKLIEKCGAVKFDISIHHYEDLLFVVQSAAKSDGVAHIPEALYHYCRREGSATTLPLNNKTMTALDVYDTIITKVNSISPSLLHLAQLFHTNTAIGFLWIAYPTKSLTRGFIPGLRKEACRFIFAYLFSKKVALKIKIRYIVILLCPKLANKLWTLLKACFSLKWNHMY